MDPLLFNSTAPRILPDPAEATTSPAISPHAIVFDGGRGAVLQALQREPGRPLRELVATLPAEEQRWLRGFWGRAYHGMLLLDEETNPRLLGQGWNHLAFRLETEQKELAAIRLYQAVTELPEVPENLRREAREERDLLLGNAPEGRRFDAFLRRFGRSPLEQLSGITTTAGGIVGLGTILFSRIPGLRPFSAAGLRFLSAAPVAGMLLSMEGYLLAHQAPHAYRAAKRLLGISETLPCGTTLGDFLECGRFMVGGVGFFVGASSFALGGIASRENYAQLIQRNLSSTQARNIAWIRGDSVRRAVQDPMIWEHFAREIPNWTLAQRNWLVGASRLTERTIVYGSASLGVLGIIHGYSQLRTQFGSLEAIPFWEHLSIGLGLALDLSPWVNLALYRAGRGDRRFNTGPALSEELTKAVYDNHEYRRIVMERSDQSIVPLLPEAEAKFRATAEAELRQIEEMLDKAEQLPSITPVRPSQEGTRLIQIENWMLPNQPFGRSLKPLRPLAQDTRANRVTITNYSFEQLNTAYRQGDLSPNDVLAMILNHPVVQQGPVFPRDIRNGLLNRRLRELTAESEARFQSGRVRPLEGVFIVAKDLFTGVDGMMRGGSKTSLVQGVRHSYVTQRLLELGAIPLPVGMVAAANGGAGKDAGFGYIEHSTRPGYDPGGSSSGTGHVMGLDDFPALGGTGSDTGGSVKVPAAAARRFGFVPPWGVIPTMGSIPFYTPLDHVGVISRQVNDGMILARLLSEVAPGDPNIRYADPSSLYQIAVEKPDIVYLNYLLSQGTSDNCYNFSQLMGDFQMNGYKVYSLGREWNFISQVPLLLFPYDAYVGTAFTHTNPLQRNFWDPRRITLNENLNERIPKGVLSLRYGYYDRARAAAQRYERIMREKIGRGVVLASPTPEALLSQSVHDGTATPGYDGHDRKTMPENRVADWGTMVFPARRNPDVGSMFSGELPDLMHLNKVMTQGKLN